MVHQTSRLHRLLTLLDTGSTSTTRRTAARQIGEIARLHPGELRPLLRRVRQYLRSKDWDTRVAAAQAIGAIAENVRHVTLKELFTKTETELAKVGFVISLSKVLDLTSSGKSQSATSLSFSSFDIQRVMEFGASLLASTGQEFDVNVDNTKTAAERLARQKKNLRRRLGLDVCEQFMDINDMIHDEDIVIQRGSQSNGDTRGHGSYTQTGVKQEVHDLVANMVPGHLSRSLSAREKNLLKRKAKGVVKDGGKDWPEDEDAEEAAPKRAKGTKAVVTEQPLSADKLVMESVVDEDIVDNEASGHWPFGYFVELLILDMFDSVWEVRHGSIMALREILSTHAASAAVIFPSLDAISSSIESAGSDLNRAGSDGKGRNFELDLNAGFEEDGVDAKKVKHDEDHGMEGPIHSGDEKPTPSGAWQGKGDVGSEGRRDPEKPILDLNTIDLNLDMNDEPSEKSQTIGESSGALTESPVIKSEPQDIDVGADDLLVKIPSNSKASKLFMAAKESWAANLEFIQDTTIRLLCVFALDRFGDYVSDQVVAPVRETCAQVLGASLKHMPEHLVLETLSILLQMQNRSEWEVRHGSLLGIKYLVAVRQDMLPVLLPRVLPACMVGLGDADDDVRAVAAEALTPAAATIVSSAGSSVPVMLLCLWDILLDLDDLSPSTSSVMHLLAELYSQPGVVAKTVTAKPPLLDLNESADDPIGVDSKESGCGDDPYTLASLAPRLWPFMRHNITSVRHAAIRTLERLLEAGNQGNLGDCQNGGFWAAPILGDSLRLVFQNLLLESDEAILECSKRVWRLLVQCPQDDLASAAGVYFPSWLKLASTALGSPLEVSKMFNPNSLPRRSRIKFSQKPAGIKDGRLRVGGSGSQISKDTSVKPKASDGYGSQGAKVVVGADGEKSAVQMRVATSSALGIMAANLPDNMLESINSSLRELLGSVSGVESQVAAMVIVSWFKELRITSGNEKLERAVSIAEPIRARLLQLLAVTDPAAPTPGSPLPYTETLRIYSKMRGEAGAFIKNAEASGVNVGAAKDQPLDSMSAEAAIQIAKSTGKGGGPAGDSKLVSNSDLCESSRQRLLATAGYLICVQANLHVSVQALLAGAVVWMGELPAKLNPIIHPLLAAVKREQEENLQQPAAEALGEVIGQCAKRKPIPIEKLMKNVVNLTCQDPVETPLALPSNAAVPSEDSDSLASSGKTNAGTKGKVQASTTDEDERAKIEGAITRRGAELCLKALCEKFGSLLFEELPKLWECLTESLGQGTEIDSSPSSLAWSKVDLPTLKAEPQALINNLQAVRSVAPVLSKGLHSQLLTLLPAIIQCVAHHHALVRLSAAKCITAIAKPITDPVMAAVLTKAVPMLGDMSSVEARQGAGVLVSSIVEGLGPDLVAYAPHLIVPLLGCMSDTNRNVRQSVTHSFAALVPLLPLARGLPSPSGLDGRQASKTTEDTRFLEQLLDNTRVDDYEVVVPVNATLRRYQQEGINWLAFLKRFKLHGILCDDMGLGKTLQASVIIASDTAERRASYKQSRNPDVAPLPSLIVCPSTLVGHWVFEIEKFIPRDALNPLQYSGTPHERLALQSQFSKHNVIVTSYDVLRKDIDFLSQKIWNYCVLDEGHAIKNAKSKITMASKQIQAEHRLILSGTPIQNHVLELWSLFDFLMPGFLGSERQFQASYGKPLSAARDAKCSPKEAEDGALAMEALHKQVMPFLLRRTKDEVLADLPPKIIQDRYCDLSPLQLKLYEGFSRSQAKKEVASLVENYGTEKSVAGQKPAGGESAHVFQALQYLRRLCSHPLLVLNNSTSKGSLDVPKVDVDGGSGLHDLENAPKLLALKEILEECGIGLQGAAEDSEGGQHRVLVFAQLKSFLDIIEQDLFATHMKGVTYLRLDGSVETEKRFGIVKAFNADPTIDVLLLTTHVGGLGLNLTAADTVVFMEHDWNPMRDLQAMDRAHRLGQRRVVNVHRLIMRGTLEEKIMSLQRFKLSVANTVINAENASLNTMDTTQLLDLFAISAKSGKVTASKKNGEENADDTAGANAAAGGKGMKAMLNGLEELWDQSQYRDEYNLNDFVSRLKN